MVAVASLVPKIVLVPFGRAVHLFEEAGIGGVAVRIIRAAQAHRRFELEIVWIGGREQMLLLLQHGEQHLLADAACLARLVDNRRRAFVRATIISLAIFVRGLRFGAERHGLQASFATAGHALLFDDGADLLLAQRIAVEERARRK